MKLREIKTETSHYFRDEQGRRQGEYKVWYGNGHLTAQRHYKDDQLHGEYKVMFALKYGNGRWIETMHEYG